MFRRRGKAGPASKKGLFSRRLGEPPVLLALAAILVGAVCITLLLAPRSSVEDAGTASAEAGASGEDSPGAEAPGEDSPEAGFARDMAIHHAQAVRMAEVVRDSTQDPAIRVLAIDIVLNQQAEIGQMRGWLEVWGLTAGQTRPAMAWMGHPTEKMPGMASPEDLARLQQAPAEEADAQFLQLMIPHHEAAVEMAEAVLQLSDRPEIVRFAQKTATSQRAEINGMQALLQRKGLPPVEVDPSMMDTAGGGTPEGSETPAEPETDPGEEVHGKGHD